MLNKDFIQVYPDFLAKEDVNNLNLFLYQQGPVVIKEIYFLEKLNDAEIEVAPNFEIKNKTIQKTMRDAEAKVIDHITNVYFPELGYEAELKWSRPLELIRWGHNARLDDHTDAPKPTDDETVHLSALIYINDNYTGGEINFPEYEIEIKPKTNDLIVFSGSMTHNVGFVGERTDEEQDERRFTMPFFFDFKIKPYSE